VALECARLQHRFSMPALEVEDFPQIDMSDSKVLHSGFTQQNTNEVDILQEILSVASASHELANNSPTYQDIWAANINPQFEEYASLVEPRHGGNQFCSRMDGLGSSWSMAMPCGIGEQINLVEIGDLEEEFKEEKKMVENLRAVKTLDTDVLEVR